MSVSRFSISLEIIIPDYHLSHDNCLEIVAVKGHANKLTVLSEKLISIKGIKHGKLVMGRCSGRT